MTNEGDYRIEIELSAAESLTKIPNPDRGRIVKRIDSLAADPRPANATKLVGTDAWRVRQGDYRIVYVIDDAVRVLTVTRIAHRSNVYKEMS